MTARYSYLSFLVPVLLSFNSSIGNIERYFSKGILNGATLNTIKHSIDTMLSVETDNGATQTLSFAQ